MSILRELLRLKITVFLSSIFLIMLTPGLSAQTPSGLTATGNDLYVSLTWQPVNGATQYNIYRISGNPSPGAVGALPASTPVFESSSGTSVIDSQVTAGQTYTYYVTAVTPTGESASATPASATPQVNLVPVVKMSAPTDGTIVTAGTTLTLSSTVQARTGTIARVDFESTSSNNASGTAAAGTGTLIGSASTSPYSIIWTTPSTNSTMAVTCVATDSSGHTATSTPINVTLDGSVPSGAQVSSVSAIALPAIAQARTFCQVIGAPIPDGTPTHATYQTVQTYTSPVWVINFLGAASIQISDGSDIVTSYVNTALAHQLDTNTTTLIGTPITQAQAQTIAATVLEASNQATLELGNQNITLSNLLSPPNYAGSLQTVRWNRVASSIPYRTDKATLLLQAESGAVEVWGLSFSTPTYAGATTPTISQAQAQQIAQTAMIASGQSLGLTVTTQVFQVSQLVITQPNNFWPSDKIVPIPPIRWSGGQSDAIGNPIGRIPLPTDALNLVWDCYFSDMPASGSPSGSTFSEVWVDATTGNVVGGNIATVAGRSRAKKATLRPLIPMAKGHR